MNCLCGMVDRRKAIFLTSRRDHCQRFSQSQISDTSRGGFKPVQNLSSGFAEWSCAFMLTITLRCVLYFCRIYRKIYCLVVWSPGEFSIYNKGSTRKSNDCLVCVYFPTSRYFFHLQINWLFHLKVILRSEINYSIPGSNDCLICK